MIKNECIFPCFLMEVHVSFGENRDGNTCNGAVSRPSGGDDAIIDKQINKTIP
jgi:hypothetical protein